MLTFIVTTYNRPRELGRLLASLCAQTDTDFETIIVDDNSSDPTTAGLCDWFLNRRRGEYIRTDVLDERRPDLVRYAENINFVLATERTHGDLIMYLCDDAEVRPELVDTVDTYFRKHPDHLAGYVSEEWQREGVREKVLWYGQPLQQAFCALDHSQVVHRSQYAVPWPVHPLAWPFADGVAFERLLGRVGLFYPIGDGTPLVINHITDTSVCRQPVEQALEKLTTQKA